MVICNMYYLLNVNLNSIMYVYIHVLQLKIMNKYE